MQDKVQCTKFVSAKVSYQSGLSVTCLIKGNHKIPCHFSLIVYFRKQFPQYGKKKTNVMKRQSMFIPKNTCTINICCLTMKGSYTTPNSEQLINLSLAGLRKKRVVFQAKMEIIIFFKKLRRKASQNLKKLEDAFALYHAVSGGSGCRKLLKIPMGQGGYSLEWIRVSCSVGSSSTLYVVPIKQDLDVEEQVH